jgi:hypothetical protein
VRSGTSALVSWTPAVSDGGSAIGWYVIESESSGNPVVKVSALATDTSQTVDDLTAGGTYTFKIYSVNDVKYSAPAITAPITLTTIIQQDLLLWLDAPTYAGSGTWFDKTDNDYDAIIEDGTATKSGNAIVLNGSTGWRLPGSSPTGIGSYPNWTLSAWFKRTGVSGNVACIFTEVYSGGTINMAFLSGDFGIQDTQFAGGFFDGGDWRTGTPITFPLNEWHQIVTTWDGTNIKTYFDSVLNSTVNYAGSVSETSGNYIRIGRRWDNPDFVQGELGELLVYSRALTSEEISTNYGLTQPNFINPP